MILLFPSLSISNQNVNQNYKNKDLVLVNTVDFRILRKAYWLLKFDWN